jgi:hypothetical protein
MTIIDTLTEQKLVSLLPLLQITAMEQLQNQGSLPPDPALSDIRDYFMYLVLRCENRKDAVEIADRFMIYSAQMEQCGDTFHAAFFFALMNMLCLRFEIVYLPGEKISYEDFEKSFVETLKRLKKYQEKKR